MNIKNLKLFGILFVFTAFFASQANAQTKYTVDAEMLKELQKIISVVELSEDWTDLNRQSPVINPNKSRTAYVASSPIDGDNENLREMVVINETKSDKFYEIQGLDSPRPIENIKWQSNDVIVFDQWMNPTRGGRYAVNLKTKKLVAFGFLE
jgi:hypothetical protein